MRIKLINRIDKALNDGKIKLYQVQEGKIGILNNAGNVWTWFSEVKGYSEGLEVLDSLYITEATIEIPQQLEDIPIGAIGKLTNGSCFEVIGRRLRAHTDQTVLSVKFGDGYVNNLTYRVLRNAVIKWGAEQ